MSTPAFTKPFNAATILAGTHRPDFDVIASWVPQGAHVLDLGCGDGTLLHKLITERSVTGYGVEKNDTNVATCVAKGLPVLQQDLESGLAWFEDDSFDVAVLSLTLQAVHQTENIMREIVRVGKKAIVSVPNFGFWQHRIAVLRGRMPVSKTCPMGGTTRRMCACSRSKILKSSRVMWVVKSRVVWSCTMKKPSTYCPIYAAVWRYLRCNDASFIRIFVWFFGRCHCECGTCRRAFL